MPSNGRCSTTATDGLGNKEHFMWLTYTNRGAGQVSSAALEVVGETKEELSAGYEPDPQAKADIRIVAKPGLMVRITRNRDKQRGFVNGAIGMVIDALRGNAVFTVRLLGTGNMVLVYPMKEGGVTFLPVTYGYSTTVRRAQGADMHRGCIYFDQLKFPAARGYGYVACSRFKTRAGCFLYGKMRRSDFLPVGEEKETEQVSRGVESEDSGSDSEGGMSNTGCAMEDASASEPGSDERDGDDFK